MTEPKADPPEPRGDAESRPYTSSRLDMSLDGPTGDFVPAHPPSDRSFFPGKVLSGRFRILRCIGKGGMGEVYEAEDLDLKERVALKTMRTDESDDENSLQRFKQEIQLARKVTHPNVSRVFDLFRHRDEGSSEEILFVSMELLHGETLSEHRRRRGRIPPAELLPIVRQLAAGLDSAHRAGVIHRDFKSGNIFLCRATPGDNAVRVVITDFGLARASGRAGSTLTKPGEIVGTPAYMAPEQVEGGEVTPATDVYALGVVLFELVTGTFPFMADTPLGAAYKRLKVEAPSARSVVPDLDERWDIVISRCLQRSPGHRFASVLDVAETLEGRGDARRIEPEALWLPAAGSVPRKRLAAAGAFALIVLSLAGIWKVVEWLRPAPAVPSARPSVAVLGFKNNSEGDVGASLGNQLADAMVSELGVEGLRVAAAEDVRKMQQDLFLPGGVDALNAELRGRVRDYLGADVLVVGSYTVQGQAPNRTLRWDVKIEDAASGQMLASFPQTGREADTPNLIRLAGATLREKLGVKLTEADSRRLQAPLTTDPEASRLYAEGMARLQRFDFAGGVDLLGKALSRDPNFVLPYVALADAWSDFGYDQKAQEAAAKARGLSVALTGAQRRMAEARWLEINHRWAQAAAIYSDLRKSYPDQPELGLRLARVQREGGQVKDALETVASLRGAAAPPGVQARLDLEEAEIRDAAAEYKEKLAAATRATNIARQLGARLLLSRSRTLECSARIRLGDNDDAAKSCEEARQLAESAGARQMEARAITGLGNAARAKGDVTLALRRHSEAWKIARDIGSLSDQTGALNNLAVACQTSGKLSQAEQYYKLSLEIARRRENKWEIALAFQNLAGILYQTGDRQRAADAYDEAQKNAAAVGDSSLTARVLNNLCMCALEGGNIPRAKRSCEDSLKLRRSLAAKGDIATSLVNTGDVLLASGDLAAARNSYEQALAIHRDLGQRVDAAYDRAQLARAALFQNDAASALRLAREALSEPGVTDDKYVSAFARAVLAAALLMQKQVTPAGQEWRQAQQAAREAGDPYLNFMVATTGARISAAAGDAAKAMVSLESVIREAKRAGLAGAEFEATLALGEIEIQTGHATGGATRLHALRAAAMEKGFVLIAQRAARS